MIIFNGIKNINNVPFLIFKNNNDEVQIPIDPPTSNRISKYLNKFNIKTEERKEKDGFKK